MVPFRELVPDSIVLIQEDEKEDYNFEENDYSLIGNQVIDFLTQFIK